MPVVDCVVECPVADSFRVQQVAGMFDVPLAEKASAHWSVEVPSLDEPWQIGVIVGPSGAGKSTIARHAFGNSLYDGGDWPAEAVIDGFPDGMSIRDITALLTSVGFSSPPAWVKPYRVLSNGERFRCDLARSLLTAAPIAGGQSLVVFDEFTSVVDRTVAKVGSAAVAKHIRRSPGLRFVAVTCHYDIVDWLEPDWVLDMASGQLARGRLWRRPPIAIKLRKTSHRYWPLFAKHHYLNSAEIPGATCYVGEVEGQPACFVAVRSAAGHKGIRRISRIVTLPDFQGTGIGTACLNAVAEITLRQPGVERVTIVSGHPAMMHALARSPRWKKTRFQPLGSSKPTSAGLRIQTSTGRAVAAFEYVPPPPSQESGTAPYARPTESAPRAAADPPVESTTAPTQTDPRTPRRRPRSRKQSPTQ